VQLYEKEMKRKGGVTHGGRRTSEPVERAHEEPKTKKGKAKEKEQEKEKVEKKAEEERSSLKRSLEPESDTDSDSLSAEEAPNKKVKKSKGGLPPITHHMMLSGDTSDGQSEERRSG